MNSEKKPRLFILGGASGIAGTLCYSILNVIPMNNFFLYSLSMLWPILSIIFVFSLYSYIALDRQSTANQLSFIFASLGFTIVACMISVQLSVRFGIAEYISQDPENKENLKLILNSVRLVDHGIDVAWDLFIGISLIFLSNAMNSHNKFRLFWSIPSLVLGILLISLNVITFPWPPDSAGLFDIGPVIGLYIILLGIKLLRLGIKMRKDSPLKELSD